MKYRSSKPIEEVREQIIRMRGRLPTKEEMRITRLYTETLWFLRGDPQEEINEEMLLLMSEYCVTLTEQIGKGCPIKAAEDHFYCNKRLNERIAFSTVDESVMEH